MTQEEIIRMAREAGLLAENEAWISPHQEAMGRFAALVAAHEREACAKVCELVGDGNGNQASDNEAYDCAAAIRSRNNAS